MPEPWHPVLRNYSHTILQHRFFPMKKKLFPALALSVIAASSVSLNAAAGNLDVSKEVQVTAQVRQMIRINGLQNQIIFNENSAIDDYWIHEWTGFTVGRRGPAGQTQLYSITLSTPEGQGEQFYLKDGTNHLAMHADFIDETNTPRKMHNDVAVHGQQTSESINSTTINARLSLGILRNDYNQAPQGNYSAPLTVLVQAE